MGTQRTTNWEAPKLLSVPEAAHLLGIGERLAWKMVARQELRSIRLGGRRMIPRMEIERLASAGEGS